MINKAQTVIADVTNHLIKNVENTIDILQKVQQNKSAYCSKKIFHLLGQISDQITHLPGSLEILTTPRQQKNLRLDSMMSVFNVQVKQQAPRGRSLTKVNRLRKLTSVNAEDLKVIKKRRITTFNKMVELNQRKYHETQPNEWQQKQDQLRQQMQKRKLQLQQQKQVIVKPKFLSARQLKQKFSYDYDSNRVKIKSQIKNNLVLSSKSLLAQLSKKIQKKDLPYKVKKPQISKTEVTVVVQKKKKKLPKIKRKNTIVIQDLPPPEQTFLQFSTIKNLTDKLNCEQGINFTFQDRTISNKAKKTIDNPQQTKRYSKLDYEIMKKRSKTSMSQYTHIVNKALTYQKSADPSVQRLQYQLNLGSRVSSINSKKQSNIKTPRIYVENQHLKQYLIMEEQQSNRSISLPPTTLNKSEKSMITLDKTDEYNLKYMKGIVSSRHNYYNLQQKSLLPLTPKQALTKIPYLKAREKIQNRNSIINEMKKKFEQTLRDREDRLSKGSQSYML